MKKTSFKKQIELNPKAHELSVALNMVGLNASPASAELILRAQSAMRQMKGKFDLQTAIKIKKDVDDAYSTIESDFK